MAWRAARIATPIVLVRGAGSTFSSTTEVAVVSATVPAGAFGAPGDGRQLRWTLYGVFANTSGLARNWTVRVKFGGTVMWGDVTPIASNAAPRLSPFSIFGQVSLNGATNAVTFGGLSAVGLGTLAATGGGAGLGEGDLGTDEIGALAPLRGAATVDTTVAQVFEIAMLVNATANTSFRADSFLVDIV